MKRFKRWFKENWENRSFRYGVTIAVLIIAAIAVSIYADIRDSRESVISSETQETVITAAE